MTITDKRKYKVVIPTAGIGSRLDNLTKYLNKSLISIENKPAITRIIDMFPTEAEFVIALGYKSELVKQFLSIAYPNRKFYYAEVSKYEGEGSGLGLTLLACEKYLQEPFVFCSCDTIVSEQIPYPDKNIVGYANRDNISQYRTLTIKDDTVLQINEKGYFSENLKAYIGLCCIKDFELFWKEMHNGKNEAISTGESYALKKFADKKLLYAKEFTWFDTGNAIELSKTREYFKEENSPNILPKPDEAIWFVNNDVIKYSNNKKFITDRVKRTEFLDGFVPKIKASTENMYSYKKEEGIVLSKIENISLFEDLLEFCSKFWVNQNLSQEENNQFLDTCKDFYYTKTLNRLNLYYETFKMQDCEYIINGKKYPKLSDILDKVNWKNICNGLAGRFHGDFHFENIIYNSKNKTFTFLDWRQNFGKILEYGDIYYDLAKLLHGLIICHELIAKNKYNIQIDNSNVEYSFERKQILEECEQYYYNWLPKNGYDLQKVKIMTALIYLNIAALHHYPYCHLLYFLGREILYENI